MEAAGVAVDPEMERVAAQRGISMGVALPTIDCQPVARNCLASPARLAGQSAQYAEHSEDHVEFSRTKYRANRFGDQEFRVE